MTALTRGRTTKRRAGETVSHPLAAGVTLHQGGIACLDAAGDLVPGSTATGLKAVGVAATSIANPGAAGAVRADVDRAGAFCFANHGPDPVDRTHIGGTAWIVDDQTVAATDDGGTRSAAGKIIDLDANGVWVTFA